MTRKIRAKDVVTRKCPNQPTVPGVYNSKLSKSMVGRRK
jgi:hypothetical protein